MAEFSDRALWGGPSLTLTLELGPAGDDARAADAYRAFWRCPLVSGPWQSREEVGEPVTAGAAGGRDRSSIYGLLRVPPCGARVDRLAFYLTFIRERPPQRPTSQKPAIIFHGEYEERSDWLTLDIPVAMLERCFPFNPSWTVADNPWLSEICRAFAEIGDWVYRGAPFVCGAIGEEVSGCWRRPTLGHLKTAAQEYPPCAVLTAHVIEERGGFLVAPALWNELAPATTPTSMPSGLLYVPPRSEAPLLGA